MKKIATLILGMMAIATTVQAADPTDGKSSSIATQKILCQRVSHQPTHDVAYNPGVDVNGNPVTPVDINPSALGMQDFISVPLTVDLAQRLNFPLPPGTEMQGSLGNLSVYKDGRVNFNGRDLTPQAAALCGGKEVPPAATAQPVKAMQDDYMPSTDIAAETDSIPAFKDVPAMQGNAQPGGEPVKVQYVFQPGKPPAGSVAPSATTPYLPPGPPPMATRADPKSPQKPVILPAQPQPTLPVAP